MSLSAGHKAVGVLWRVAAVIVVAGAPLAAPAGMVTTAPPAPPRSAPAPAHAPSAQPARPRNLFLAPPDIRRARGQIGQGLSEGLPPVGPRAPGPVPSPLPLPPPGAQSLPVLPPMPGVPPPGLARPLGQRRPAGPPPPAAGEQTAPAAQPELVGVVAGTDPQAILAHRGRIVVARVGERTPWGVLVEVREGAAVLRTPDRTLVVMSVHLEGVK